MHWSAGEAEAHRQGRLLRSLCLSWTVPGGPGWWRLNFSLKIFPVLYLFAFSWARSCVTVFFGCATRLTESESPDQGLNSCPLQWKGRVQTTGPLGNPFVWLFLSKTRGLWIKTGERTSLVVQWIRIHPPMQETQVRSLVWGDVTCHRTTKSVRHSYQAHILEPLSHSYWARELQVLKPVHLERVLCNWRSH